MGRNGLFTGFAPAISDKARMKSLIVTAPEPIRAEVKGTTTTKLVKSLAAWESPIGRPAALHAADPQIATIHVLGNMARRYQRYIVRELYPHLLAAHT
jgi:hypothetical protein